MPWTQSAAWVRISGKASSVDTNSSDPNYTPDLDPSVKPTNIAGDAVVREVNTDVDAVGGGLVCGAENSKFGSIGNFFGSAADLISNIGDFGLSEAATAAAVTALQTVLDKVLVPDIVKYFTPVGIFGKEFSTQWLDVADLGTNLSSNDYFRSLGAQPISNAAAATQYSDATQSENKYEDSQSFTYRTFALSNPDSVISRFALSLPENRTQLVSGISSYFNDLPSELLSKFSDIITPTKLFADTTNPSQDPTPGIAYGVTQYGDTGQNEYDPISNEYFLNQPITYQNVSVKRITMLGNPLDQGDNDTSTTDVLHCFTQSAYQGTNPPEDWQGPDPICGTVGDYDSSITPWPIGATQVATSYCDYFADPSAPTAGGATSQCISTLTPEVQAGDDIDHFSQYLMDTHIMNDYDDFIGTGSSASDSATNSATSSTTNSATSTTSAYVNSLKSQDADAAKKDSLTNFGSTLETELNEFNKLNYNDTFSSYGSQK